MAGPTFRAGDEIEWLDRSDGPERWRPGRILAVTYEVGTDVPGEWFACRPEHIRSAPRLPLEGIES